MSTAVRLPDGRVIQTNATNARDAQSAASRFMAAEDAQKRARSSPNQVRSIANGPTLGLANLADAAGAAGETGLYNLTHPGQGHYGMGDAFQAVRRANEAQDQQFQQQHPVQATVLSLLGGLAMPGGGALLNFVKGAERVAPVARTVLGRVGQAAAQTAPVAARSAAVGAGLGAVGGAATADPGREAQGAVAGGATGLLTGAATPFAGRAAAGIANSAPVRTVARAASKASGALGGPVLNPARQAQARLVESLQRDGASPDVIRARTNDWLRSGVNPALLDVANDSGQGQATMALLRGAAMKSPGARNIMVTRDRQVAGDLVPNAMAATRRLTPGDTQSAEQAIASREAARSAQASTTYAAPYAADAPVLSDEARAALSDTPGQSVLRSVRADAQERLGTDPGAQRQLDDIDRLMTGDFSQPVAGSTLDRIRIGFGERSGKLSRAGNNSRAAGALGRRDVIENELDDVPGLADARGAYRDASKGIEAVQLGQGGLSPATVPADYADQLSGLGAAVSPTAGQDITAAAQTGLRSAAKQAIGNGKDGAVGPLNTLRNSNNRAVFASTFGDDAASAYDSTLDKLIQQRSNAAKLNPTTGSDTGARLEDAGFSVHPAKLIPQIVAGIRNGMTLTDAERDALAQMATLHASDFTPPTPASATPNISSGASLLLAPYLARQAGAAQ